MENREAIRKIKFMRDAYQKLIDENVDEGRFVGTNVTGTWKSDTPLNEVYREHVDALDLVISALEKQEVDKCCETCKYGERSSLRMPCWNCYRATAYEDCYEAEKEA